MASDLAEELKALQVQKDALEVRNKQLEAALNISTQNSSSPSTRGERPSEVSTCQGAVSFYCLLYRMITLPATIPV